MSATCPPRSAAFFDLDRTVLATVSTLAFRRTLSQAGLLSAATVARAAYAQTAMQLFGASARQIERSRAALLRVTEGWDAQRVRDLVNGALEEVITPRIYPEAVALLAQHRRAGRRLYLVSTSGVEVVEPIAAALGVPHVIATRTAIDAHGRYAGALDFFAYGPAKAAAMRAEAAAHGLELAESYAYSDSVTDLPMLESVGTPVAVNPDRRLRAVAAARGWQIRDFARPRRHTRTRRRPILHEGCNP